ncbi:hypothetical protein [Paenibacillus sp. NEAU-GSW1]|uniref:hypothetical protein n=1 Tax=Paenibacillus sp. NEAU-GSW1 TaxID=2682486 RepID=UPI0020A6BE63|nr:hypothetical protein [Paenibacillus sp. NEAU-GSW1]
MNFLAAKEMDGRLFAGERLLVMVGLLGIVLAAIVALYIGFNGAAVLPEGDLESAFSFDAALGVFILSIAAILPLSGFASRKRAMIRWVFIIGALYSYAVETIQHLRGINPRYTQVGTIADSIFGYLFALESLVFIVFTVLLAIPFFRKDRPVTRPLLVLGIRYAFVSTMVAFAGGLWMIALMGRYTGDAGNLIVLHGLSFHALQALPLIGWLLERARTDGKLARRWIHAGSIAWTMSILLISIQTGLGQTMFELTALPALTGVMLLVWLAVAVVSVRRLLKSTGGASLCNLLKDRGLSR